jgi:N-acetylneuraminic acid mutarotase
MLFPRQALGVAAGLDSRIYAFGGATAFSSAAVTNTAECYSPVQNKWTRVANMPTGRVGIAGATGSDGLIYAIGGSPDYGLTIVTTVEAYNPRTGAWSTRASLNTARLFPAAATGPDGRIYVFGGTPDGFTTLNSVECYNPVQNKWTTVASMPTARILAAASLAPNGRLVVMGGTTNAASLASPTNVVESYNPGTMTWTTVTPMPTARSGLGAALGNDGRIYAVGGYDGVANALATNQALSNVGGFAGSGLAKSHDAALTGVDPSMLATTVTVSPLSSPSDQGTSSNGSTNDPVAVDAVFADGTDTLSTDLTDPLLAV